MNWSLQGPHTDGLLHRLSQTQLDVTGYLPRACCSVNWFHRVRLCLTTGLAGEVALVSSVEIDGQPWRASCDVPQSATKQRHHLLKATNHTSPACDGHLPSRENRLLRKMFNFIFMRSSCGLRTTSVPSVHFGLSVRGSGLTSSLGFTESLLSGKSCPTWPQGGAGVPKPCRFLLSYNMVFFSQLTWCYNTTI